MTVIQMSGQELTRLRIMIDLADGRITVEATAALMGATTMQGTIWPHRSMDSANRATACGSTRRLSAKRRSSRCRSRSRQWLLHPLDRDRPEGGVVRPLAETAGGPNARRRHSPGRACRSRRRSELSASNVPPRRPAHLLLSIHSAMQQPLHRALGDRADLVEVPVVLVLHSAGLLADSDNR
jgi:hypothetical protein